jgi:hypothetical protein
MLTLTFGLAVVAALLLVVPRGKWPAVACLFLLLLLSPLFFSAVLVIGGAVYYFVKVRKTNQAIPRALPSPPTEDKKDRAATS